MCSFFLVTGVYIGSLIRVNYDQIRGLFVVKHVAINTRSIDEYDPTNTEADSRYYYQIQNLERDQTALVLMDVWEEYSDAGFEKRVRKNIEESLLPLLQTARMNKLLIIHAPHKKKIDSNVKPVKGEVNLDDEKVYSAAAFDTLLKKRKIHTLIYAGYATNYCVMFRPEGLINMKRLRYDTLLVRDATVASEFPDTLKGEWMKVASVHMIESEWGRSTTVEDFKDAFSGIPFALKMRERVGMKKPVAKVLSKGRT